MFSKVDHTYIYYIPFLLSAILSLRSFWQKWPKHFKIFSIYLWVSFAVEWFAIFWKWDIYISLGYAQNNRWIYNAGLVISEVILLLFFMQVLQSKLSKKIVRMAVLAVCLVGLADYIFLNGPFRLNQFAFSLSGLLNIVFCTLYFGQVLNDSKIVVLQKQPLTWIILGLFIYNTAGLPFLIASDYLFTKHPDLSIIYADFLHDTLNIVMYTLFLIAFLCKPHPKSLSTPSVFQPS